MEERKKIILWVSFTAFALVDLFWGLMYGITGEIRIIDSIKITEDWIYRLPCGIPRLVDGIVVAIWLGIVIFYLSNEKNKRNGFLSLGLLFGCPIGFIGTSMNLVFIGTSINLVSILLLSLVFGLPLFLFFGLKVSLVLVSGIGLSAIVFAGSAFGLTFLMTVGLLVYIGAITGFSLYEKAWEHWII